MQSHGALVGRLSASFKPENRPEATMRKCFVSLLALFICLPLAPAGIAQCVLPAPGTEIMPKPIDNWSLAQPIGFAFPFAGGTYTDVYISDHGLVALNNAGAPAAPPAGWFQRQQRIWPSQLVCRVFALF